MFSLNKLFSQKKKPARKNNNFRPQLECLEKREVMSTSSLSLHAVTDAYGENVAVFVGSHTTTAGTFTGLIASTNRLGDDGPLVTNVIPTGVANTPNGVQSFSEGLDSNGRADIFVKALDGSFWYFGAQGWVKIQLPGTSQVESFAAVNDGRVYAIFQDGSLNVFTPQGTTAIAAPNVLTATPPVIAPFGFWEHVYGAGSVTALDAVTDKYGHDAVFVENADKSFGEFYNPGGALLSVVNGQAYVGPYTQLASAGYHYTFFNGQVYTTAYSQIGTFSAGTDANGYADVFANYNGYLDRYYYGSGWKEVALPKTFQSFSATDSGVAWIIGSTGSLERYNGTVLQQEFSSGGPERSVAAASSLTAFITLQNNGIEGLFLDPNPNNLGQSWGIGTTPN
ncbi:MAG TPA: hypothetical protein VKS79_24050 [Gemmataceae bacterium]|nr:hypothetical protein [Gemmataceae bacterium]